MKKLFCLLLALLMVFSLAACSGNKDEGKEGGETPVEPTDDNAKYSGTVMLYTSAGEDAAQHLNENELKRLIEKTLALPRFKLAQQFYHDNPVNWEPSNLLKDGGVNAYIDKAKASGKESLKNSMIKKLKTLWSGRDVVIIEGEKSRLGIGNNLFDNMKSIQRIICPVINAFKFFD